MRTMANEIMNEKKIALEVIATGRTIDNDPSFKGKNFEILTWTFRLNPVGLDGWLWSDKDLIDRMAYEAREDYDAAIKKAEDTRQDLTDAIREILGVEETVGFTVTQNISEIFTAVLIRRMPEDTPEPRKKLPAAEYLQRQASMLNAMLCCLI